MMSISKVKPFQNSAKNYILKFKTSIKDYASIKTKISTIVLVLEILS